ncbi:MAG TPA: hypothetical protein PKU77_10755, partial [Ferruginibacter sp.]|nr:hypothetical protein [Ferruginibacter sp.]
MRKIFSFKGFICLVLLKRAYAFCILSITNRRYFLGIANTQKVVIFRFICLVYRKNTLIGYNFYLLVTFATYAGFYLFSNSPLY